MKNNKVLYIVLSSILFVLLGSSVYVNFIAKSSAVISVILLLQIIVGIVSAMITLFLCKEKKEHQVLFISFLEIMFVLTLVTLNGMYGYKKVLNYVNYSEYMEYVSSNLNIYLFALFAVIIGLFTLHTFIKSLNNKNRT